MNWRRLVAGLNCSRVSGFYWKMDYNTERLVVSIVMRLYKPGCRNAHVAG
jgi:hypothetical protein